MTPRLIIQFPDPFLAVLVPAGLYDHPSRQEVSPIPHTGHMINHCVHKAWIEAPTDGKSQFTLQKCFNTPFTLNGRHGFLCKMHHDLDYLGKFKKGKGPVIERTEAQLCQTLQKEVDRARVSGAPIFDHKKYSAWRWSYKTEAEVPVEDMEIESYDDYGDW